MKPQTSGVAMITCAMMIARTVSHRLSEPSTPCRKSSTETTVPTTTGGKPMPVFTSAIVTRLPGNGASASSTPAGPPSTRLISVAIPETCTDSQVTRYVSASPESRRCSASSSPCQKRPIGEPCLPGRCGRGGWWHRRLRTYLRIGLAGVGYEELLTVLLRPKSPITCWVAGASMKSAKAFAPSTLSPVWFAGFTWMT